MISSDTHTMEIIKEEFGVAMIEIKLIGSVEQHPDRFYVVRINFEKGQVYSAVPADCPPDRDRGGLWVSGVGVGGVSYVANPRRRSTAQRWYKRLVDEAQEWHEMWTAIADC